MYPQHKDTAGCSKLHSIAISHFGAVLEVNEDVESISDIFSPLKI